MMELYSISIWKHKKAIAFFIIFVLFVSAIKKKIINVL